MRSYSVKLFHQKKNEKAWWCDLNSPPTLYLASVFSLGILSITSVVCGYFLISVSALHFYGMGGIFGYTKKHEDGTRTDPRSIIHEL